VPSVVDTNVLCVADRLSRQADEACIASCVSALQAMQTTIVVVDDAGRIVKEYSNNVRTVGQPGVGGRFLLWLWQNIANVQVCATVPITPRLGGGEDYEEFPTDSDLAGFDPSDKKFAAVARAHGSAVVLNAVDSDWRQFEAPLARNAIAVEFLCPQHV
jgi:hypothetical protein